MGSEMCIRDRMKTEEVKNIRAFLMTVVKNQALNYLRNEHLRMEVRENILDDELYELDFRISSLDSSDPNQLFSEEIIAIVNHTLNELPEKTRRVFIMRRFEEKSYREIASEMNMSVKGVEYHMNKATESLKKTLKIFLPLLIYLIYH